MYIINNCQNVTFISAKDHAMTYRKVNRVRWTDLTETAAGPITLKTINAYVLKLLKLTFNERCPLTQSRLYIRYDHSGKPRLTPSISLIHVYLLAHIQYVQTKVHTYSHTPTHTQYKYM